MQTLDLPPFTILIIKTIIKPIYVGRVIWIMLSGMFSTCLEFYELIFANQCRLLFHSGCVSIIFCSLIQFFNKIKKWADMANLPESFRSKVDKLERKFSVSTVIFKKYKPIFISVFKDPDLDPPKLPRSRKQRFVCLFSKYFVERTFIVM